MLIRCEKCNTLYELDEKLLPPTGAPVQCSKCQFVFKAYPSAPTGVPPANEEAASRGEAAAMEPLGPPPSDLEESAEPRPSAPSPELVPSGTNLPSTARRAGPQGGSEPGAAKPPGPAVKKPAMAAGAAPGLDEPQFTADGRPIRKVPFPTEEPAPMGPRPALGRMPVRPTAPAAARRRVLLVVPLVVALVLAAAFIAWRMLGRRSHAAAPPRVEGHSLFLPGAGEIPHRA